MTDVITANKKSSCTARFDINRLNGALAFTGTTQNMWGEAGFDLNEDTWTLLTNNTGGGMNAGRQNFTNRYWYSDVNVYLYWEEPGWFEYTRTATSMRIEYFRQTNPDFYFGKQLTTHRILEVELTNEYTPSTFLDDLAAITDRVVINNGLPGLDSAPLNHIVTTRRNYNLFTLNQWFAFEPLSRGSYFFGYPPSTETAAAIAEALAWPAPALVVDLGDERVYCQGFDGGYPHYGCVGKKGVYVDEVMCHLNNFIMAQQFVGGWGFNGGEISRSIGRLLLPSGRAVCCRMDYQGMRATRTVSAPVNPLLSQFDLNNPFYPWPVMAIPDPVCSSILPTAHGNDPSSVEFIPPLPTIVDDWSYYWPFKMTIWYPNYHPQSTGHNCACVANPLT